MEPFIGGLLGLGLVVLGAIAFDQWDAWRFRREEQRYLADIQRHVADIQRMAADIKARR